MCDGWRICSTRGGVEAAGIFGAGRVCRCVRLPQLAFQNAQGDAFVPSTNVGRFVYFCEQFVSRGTSSLFWPCFGSLKLNIQRWERKIDNPSRDKGVGMKTWTKRIQCHYMKCDGDQVWAGRRWASLDARLGRLAAILCLDDRCEERSRLPQSGGRYSLAGKQCAPEYGHHDSKVGDRDSSW